MRGGVFNGYEIEAVRASDQHDVIRGLCEEIRGLREEIRGLREEIRGLARIEALISRHDGRPFPLSPSPVKNRHRPADDFPWATIERLDELLASRRAALDAGDSIEGLSHQAIANELTALGLRFDRSRVQRAEVVRDMALEARGWDLCTLLRSDPEFCAGGDRWRLPTPPKARKILGLEVVD
jgi:hypothetical protein